MHRHPYTHTYAYACVETCAIGDMYIGKSTGMCTGICMDVCLCMSMPYMRMFVWTKCTNICVDHMYEYLLTKNTCLVRIPQTHVYFVAAAYRVPARSQCLASVPPHPSPRRTAALWAPWHCTADGDARQEHGAQPQNDLQRTPDKFFLWKISSPGLG